MDALGCRSASRSTPRTSTSTSAHSSHAVASSTRSSGSRSETTVFQLRELVDVEAGERMLRSVGFLRRREGADGEAVCSAIEASVRLAKSLHGYLPVRYYVHEAQEGFGRMKAQVMVDGMSTVSYVRMPRLARAVLAGRLYWDVDMANCQPSLLAQVLSRHQIASPLLQRYVAERDACIREVMDACSVARDDAKNLFLRLVYFGGIQGWLDERPDVSREMLPPWVAAFRDELRSSARALMQLPVVAQLKECHAKRAASFADTLPADHHSDPLASIMAIYLQTLECECVRALVEVIQADCRDVGAIIYDGILVRKEADEEVIDRSRIAQWEEAVRVKTSYTIKLVVKALDADPLWSQPADDAVHGLDRAPWSNALHLMSYSRPQRYSGTG